MKIVGNIFCGQHPNRLRQHTVQPIHQTRKRKNRLSLKIGRHPLGMYPGIGTPCSVKRDRSLGQADNRLFHNLLDGNLAQLPLPTCIGSAVIGQNKFDVSHCVYGKRGTILSPAFSGKPHMRFMFCTACPEAPFTTLSIADKMITRPVRGSNLTPISQ